MENTNLGNVITSAVTRKIIYSAYVVAGVLLGAAQVGFAAVNGGQPEWLTISLAILAYLSIPVGGLALVNTPKSSDPIVSDAIVLTDAVDRDSGF